MSKHKKIFFWLTGILATLVVFLLTLRVLGPSLINTDVIKTRIQTALSRQIGGKVEFQSVDLSIFPLPRVVIHQGKLSISNTAKGTVKSVTAYPKLFPLLTGRFQITRLRVEAPEFFVTLNEVSEKIDKVKGPITLDEMKARLIDAAAALVAGAEDLIIEIDEGKLNLAAGDRQLLSFWDIDAEITSPSGKLAIDLACASNSWQHMEMNLRLDSKDFTGSGKIELEDFQPQVLIDYFFLDAPFHIAKPVKDISLRFKAKGPGIYQAKMKSSLFSLTLFRGDKGAVISGKGLEGSIHIERDSTTVVLEKLVLESPQLSLSGRLVVDRESSEIKVELQGKDVDISSTRETALAVAGDVSTVQDIFQYMRGGTVPEITFTSHGRKIDDLTNTENFVLRGKILKGNIFVPGLDLDLKEVRGDVVVSKGILEGTNAEAVLERSRGRNGTIRVGLEGGNAPLHLEIDVETDLGEVPPLLRRLVKDTALLREMDRLYNVQGLIQGKLTLGERIDSVNVKVDISEMNVSAQYELLPYPLQISGGQFSYNETGARVSELRGTMGRSSFSDLTASLDFKAEPYLAIDSGKASMVMGEIYPWLLSFKDLGRELADFRSVKGDLSLSQMDFKGPLLRPKKWHFAMKGAFDDLTIDSGLLPGLVKISNGTLEAAPERIVIGEAAVSMLDAQLSVSGSLSGIPEGTEKTDWTINGEVGPKATKWISDLINLPRQLYLRSPLSFSRSRLRWGKDGKSSFTGGFTVDKGPTVSLDVLHTHEELNIIRLVVQDDESHASLELLRREGEYVFNFTGELTQATMGKIFLTTPLQYEWVRGDFKAHLFLDEPVNSTLYGKLQGKELVFPWKFKVPLTFNEISLDASGKEVDLDSIVLTWGDKHATLQGSAGVSDDGFLFDVDLSVDELDWEDIREAFASDHDGKDIQKADTLWDAPVKGVVRLTADSFAFGNFTWSPLQAELSLSRDRVDITVARAAACGISFPGKVIIGPKNLSLEFTPFAEKQDLEKVLKCLGDKGGRATGNFDFKGKISARGQRGDLAKETKGKFEFTANNGRIYNYGLLAKVLAVINVTELFRGKVPDITEEGFAYHSMTVKGNLEDGKVVLTEAVMDGASMDIVGVGEIDIVDKTLDLKLYVAPFKTIDFLIKKTPLVGKILGGKLISIPVRIKGNFGNPEISESSP